MLTPYRLASAGLVLLIVTAVILVHEGVTSTSNP
jgi:hypothetical protein